MSTELKIGAGLGILVVAVSAWFFYTRSAGSPDIPLPGDKPISMTGQADPVEKESGPSAGGKQVPAKPKPSVSPAQRARGTGGPGASAKRPGTIRPGAAAKRPSPGRSAGNRPTDSSKRNKVTTPVAKAGQQAQRGTPTGATGGRPGAPGRSVPPGTKPSTGPSRAGSGQRQVQDQASLASAGVPAERRAGSTATSADTRRGSVHRLSGSGGSSATASPGRQRVKQPRSSNSSSAVREHIVRSGESFALIAQKYFGSQKYTWYVIQANPQIKDPAKLSIGQKLRIPVAPPASASPSQPGAGRAKIAPAQRTYVVEAGDSFYDIAQRLMGDGTRWPELYELNKDQVGLDPSDLRVGQVLKVPSK